MRKAEVAHGARGSADVERIANVDEDNAEVGEFSGSGHAVVILREGGGSRVGAVKLDILRYAQDDKIKK